MHEDLVNRIAEKVSRDVKETIQSTLQQSIEREVAGALQRALSDSEFYKEMNLEVQNGLNSIYKEILQLKQETGSLDLPSREAAEELLEKTTDKLDTIIKTTEKATFEIMEILESRMEKTEQFRQKIASFKGKDVPGSDVSAFLEELNGDFLNLMTALSFQDITGQHIKKIIGFIQSIEAMIRQLYLSCNLMIRDKEMHPDKDDREIRQEAERKISQGDVDAYLSEMGLE